MRNYAEICKGICGYNLWLQLFCILFAIKKFTFCVALFKRILAWERDFSKT